MTDRETYYHRLQAIFDDTARTRGGYYDSSPQSKHRRHTLWQRLNRMHIKKILSSRVRDLKLRSCLDVGCGIGDFSQELSECFGFERVHGIDLSPSVIEIAQTQYGGKVGSALSFSVGDVASGLSFSDREVDLALCLNVFHHLLPDDQEAAIGHLCRVAREMVILEVKRYHMVQKLLTGYRAMGIVDIYPVQVEDVVACFAKHGFRPVVIRPIFYVLGLSPIAILALVRESDG